MRTVVLFISKLLILLDTPAAPSLKIDADLEEFRIILASKRAKLFDVQVQGENNKNLFSDKNQYSSI